jgi:polyisoprenoid-binding protein YceI
MVAAAANLVQAQSKTYGYQIGTYFQIKNLGFNTGGNIGGLVADINFDKDKPENSSIEATVDAKYH